MENFLHKPSGFKFSYLSLILIAISFLIGWQANSFGIFAGQSTTPADVPDEFVAEDGDMPDGVDLGLFWKVWSDLEKKYVDESVIDYDSMTYGSIKGMVDSLDDPYTVFMTPKESSDFSASLEGTLEGIGIELTVEDQALVIVSPLRDSPAEKAGLLPGDVVYKIDGEFASEMTLFDAIMGIRGEKGTTVVLTIIREGLEDAFDVSIVRDSIDLESVTVEKLDGNIVYVSVNQFNDKTTDHFRKAISDMILNEPDGLIVDLRFNGGGYLDIAVDILSFLLPSDKSAVIIKQRGKADEKIVTGGSSKLLNVPLVVLVNHGSASASEIVAGAVQDHERGIVMGTQTFGKGSVQEVEKFQDGSSMRLTIAKWFTPDDRTIDKVGITPDIIVEAQQSDLNEEVSAPEAVTSEKVDIQKQEAVKYLQNL